MNLYPICPLAARVAPPVLGVCPGRTRNRRLNSAVPALGRLLCGRPATRLNGGGARRWARGLTAAALVTFTVTLASFAPASAAARSPRPPRPPPPTAEIRSDRILVRPKPGTDPSVLQSKCAAFGCTVLESFARMGNLTVLQVPPDTDVRTVIGQLAETGLFAYVEPDYVGHALALPNDPRFFEQWPLNNAGGSGGTPGADIKAIRAWDIAHDASDIVVAVVDSGIRYTHQDLAANLWINPGESGSGREANGVDDEGDGYVDDVHGVNVLNHSGNPYDDWGHGTHVAGIIGGAGNNALGISGVAWRVKLMACKFIDANGNYAVSDAVTALDYARQHGANVVLAAWGGYSFTSTALRDAFIALRDAGIIVVAAAGNSGTDNDTTPLYPASYEYANVISVAASDRADTLASFSDYGAQTVDLAAPGVDILSCTNTSDADYRTLSGTSMASAYVAGAVALVWSHFPTDSYQQIIHRIVASVDPVPAFAGKVISGGRLDLAAALAQSDLPVVTSAPTDTGDVGIGFIYQIVATGLPTTYAATNLGGTGLSLDASTGLISGTPTVAGTIVSQLTAANAAGTSAPQTLSILVNAATLPAQKATQVISAQVVPQPVTSDATITLDATASSGLPVSYELVSGPGVLQENTLTFTGASGTIIVVRATQSGNNAFNAAESVDLTFLILAAGEHVYLGKVGGDDFGAAIAADNSHGTFATRLAATGEALVASFVVAADGSFFTAATVIPPATRSASSPSQVQANRPPRTVSGVVANGVLLGTVPELGATFTATVQAATGRTASYTGLYTATIPGSASGTTYLFAGTNGQAYALVITPSMVVSGSGTLSSDGTVGISTGSGDTITGTIDSGGMTVSGSVQMGEATLPFAGLGASIRPTDRLVNVSARLRVSGNDSAHASIAGFVIAGVAPKPVLVRAVGSTLARYGLTNPLPDPQLQLFDRQGNHIAANTGWADDAAVSDAGNRVGAFSLGAGSRDAALVMTLPPGTYTAQVSSANRGVALLEMYDMGGAADLTRQLVNLSTRGFVGTGEDVLIGGFAVTGNQPKRVLIRAIGPSLAGFGVQGALGDPMLAIHDAKGVVIAKNDNWTSPQAIDAAQFPASAADIVEADTAGGAFPLPPGSDDAAVIITLQPGTYSAVVTGAGGGSGAALVEIYEIPTP